MHQYPTLFMWCSGCINALPVVEFVKNELKTKGFKDSLTLYTQTQLFQIHPHTHRHTLQITA